LTQSKGSEILSDALSRYPWRGLLSLGGLTERPESKKLMLRPKDPSGDPKGQRINEQIRVAEVRVIGADGAQLGILRTTEAMEAALQAGLDLVEVAPNERPPVCRIMDYGKYKYQQKKRLNRSHSHQTKIKEIRVRPKTGKHDIEVKTNRARDFLLHKDKVLVTVIFRGREVAHMEEGQRVIDQVIAALQDVSKTEAPPVRHGKRISCTLTPK
jgi:translation initiation factor IF-3